MLHPWPFFWGGGGVDRSNSNICSSLLGIRGVVAQLVGRREVGPEGPRQVLDAVVSGVRSQVLHPGEEVGGRQAPVGHAALVPGLCWGAGGSTVNEWASDKAGGHCEIDLRSSEPIWNKPSVTHNSGIKKKKHFFFFKPRQRERTFELMRLNKKNDKH